MSKTLSRDFMWSNVYEGLVAVQCHTFTLSKIAFDKMVVALK